MAFTPMFAVIPQIRISSGSTAVPHFEPGFTGDQIGKPALTTPHWVAERWVGLGAGRLQVVDDDAEDGRPMNAEAISRLVRAVKGRARVDLMAGIRDGDALRAAGHTGADRLVLELNSSAESWIEPAVAVFGDRLSVLVSLDGRGGAGSTATSVAVGGEPEGDLVSRVLSAGIGHFVVREPERSGHWWQHHHRALADLCRRVGCPVTAGTPVERLEQLHELCELVPLGLDGAIMGHALVEGSLTFAEAQAAAEARFDPYEWGPARP